MHNFWGDISERGVNNKINLKCDVFNLGLSTFLSHRHSRNTLEPPILLTKVASVLCLSVWSVHSVDVCAHPSYVQQYLFVMRRLKFASSGVLCIWRHVILLPPFLPPFPPLQPPPPPLLLESELRDLMSHCMSLSKRRVSTWMLSCVIALSVCVGGCRFQLREYLRS